MGHTTNYGQGGGGGGGGGGVITQTLRRKEMYIVYVHTNNARQ